MAETTLSPAINQSFVAFFQKLGSLTTDVQGELKKLATAMPVFFQELLKWSVAYYDSLTASPVTPVANPGDLDVTTDDGTGSYNLVSVPVPESIRRSIREQFARGVIYEEAEMWLKGLITGLMFAAH